MSGVCRGALKAALALGVKLLPGMCSPRGAAGSSMCAHGEGQVQQCRLPDKTTPLWSAWGTLTHKIQQANVIQGNQRRQFIVLLLLNDVKIKKSLMASWSSL